MRILLVHNLPPWDARAGGGQRVQHEIAAHAVAAGHDARVLYLGDPAEAPAVPYEVIWVGERRGRGLKLAADAVAVARAVRRAAERWRPDVVHASAAEAGLLPRALPPGIGLVATSHHPDPPTVPSGGALPRSPGALRRLQAPLLEAELLRGAHRVVAVSRWGADALRARGYLPPDRPVAVVPNGVGAEWFARPAEQRDDGGAPAFLFVGRLEHAKGWDVLLDALAAPGAPRGARVDLAGGGPDGRALADRVAALGLGDRVRALGRLTPDELRARLAGARALVLPSRRENYPLVLLEAMAAGVPVIATRVGGVAEMIGDGVSGLLVPPDDSAALAAALARVAGERALRSGLRTAGHAVAERHRWERVVARLVEEYSLAAELARPVPRAPSSQLSAPFRRAAARAAVARAPRAHPSPPPADVRRIAVVRPGRLGDLLLADPLLAALAERHPRATIDLITDADDLVPPWMIGAPVARRTLALRRGPDAWRRPGEPERTASLRALAEAWNDAPPDLLLLAVDLADPVARSLSGELAAAAPSAWRAGLCSTGAALPELHATVTLGPAGRHEIARLLALGGAAGADPAFRLPRTPTAPSPLPPWSGPTLAVHPGASRPTKQWPLARWGALAARAAERGVRTVVVGDARERAWVDELGIAFDERAFVDRVGRLGLAELAAALAGADAFAGNDSFPFHLAVAAGTRALVLVGPSAAHWTAYPEGLATVVREPVLCSPRHGEECPVYTTCPHGACMQSIRVDDVAETLLRALT